MRKYRYFYVILLALVALPLYGQGSVSKQDVLGAVTMSGALIACGYSSEGASIGQAAVNLFPQVGLHDKSDEVVDAFVKGGQSIQSGEVTCADVVNYAKRAGVME